MEALDLLKRQFLVAEVFSISIRIDYRWFAVWALMSWLIAAHLPDTLLIGSGGKFLLGAITSLVFFACVLVHELAHAFVARSEGIDVLEIVLHPFGGVARLRREPRTPGADFRIAIAGPGASFLTAALFFGLWGLSSKAGTDLLTPAFFLLFLLNLLLAVFNLFPGYPLDGGRVLRAFIWKRGSDLPEATVLAGKFGKIIAAALIVFGIAVAVVNSDLFTGAWTVIVGLFLYDSASGIIRSIEDLDGKEVENVMEFAFSVDPSMTVMRFVDEVVFRYRKTVFPVSAGGRPYGFLLLDDLKSALPREKWNTTTVGEAIRPVSEECFIKASARVAEAAELLRTNGFGIVAVLESDGRFVGVVERGKVRRRH